MRKIYYNKCKIISLKVVECSIMCNCCHIVNENIMLKTENKVLKNRIKELESSNKSSRRRCNSTNLREKYRNL